MLPPSGGQRQKDADRFEEKSAPVGRKLQATRRHGDRWHGAVRVMPPSFQFRFRLLSGVGSARGPCEINDAEHPQSGPLLPLVVIVGIVRRRPIVGAPTVAPVAVTVTVA